LAAALSAEDRAGLVNALKVSRFGSILRRYSIRERGAWLVDFWYLLVFLIPCGLIRLQDKLQSLAGQHTDVLEALSPNVRKRVEYLREIQVGMEFPCH
jgi:hypothetical protein